MNFVLKINREFIQHKVHKGTKIHAAIIILKKYFLIFYKKTLIKKSSSKTIK